MLMLDKKRLEHIDWFAVFNNANRPTFQHYWVIGGQKHKANTYIVNLRQVYVHHRVDGGTRIQPYWITDTAVGIARVNVQVPHLYIKNKTDKQEYTYIFELHGIKHKRCQSNHISWNRGRMTNLTLNWGQRAQLCWEYESNMPLQSSELTISPSLVEGDFFLFPCTVICQCVYNLFPSGQKKSPFPRKQHTHYGVNDYTPQNLMCHLF